LAERPRRSVVPKRIRSALVFLLLVIAVTAVYPVFVLFQMQSDVLWPELLDRVHTEVSEILMTLAAPYAVAMALYLFVLPLFRSIGRSENETVESLRSDRRIKALQDKLRQLEAMRSADLDTLIKKGEI
jgi:predicted component of type VI protein secretion system